MLGAIAGDIIGSVYEHNNVKNKQFVLLSENAFFTDDTVLTVALADTILNGTPYVNNLKKYYYSYPEAGFGGYFTHWAKSESTEPYNSFGNGAAMRVSPVGFAFESLSRVLLEAERSAAVTHNHPEGIRGAQATAAAVFLARQGSGKNAIKDYIETTFGYDLDEDLDDIRLSYEYNETCQGTVPQAMIAFLASSSYEDAIRNVISLGGDSDTLACITGGIAEAFYGEIPGPIREFVYNRLNEDFIRVIGDFYMQYLNG